MASNGYMLRRPWDGGLPFEGAQHEPLGSRASTSPRVSPTHGLILELRSGGWMEGEDRWVILVLNLGRTGLDCSERLRLR